MFSIAQSRLRKGLLKLVSLRISIKDCECGKAAKPRGPPKNPSEGFERCILGKFDTESVSESVRSQLEVKIWLCSMKNRRQCHFLLLW